MTLLMMDDITTKVRFLSDGCVKKLITGRVNKTIGGRFGRAKSKFLTACERVCGYILTRGVSSVPVERVSDISKLSMACGTPRLLRRLLAKLNFSQQALLSRAAQPDLMGWSRKSQADFVGILDDADAMRSLYLIHYCAAINPLTPIDTDVGEGRVYLGMPDGQTAAAGAILVSYSRMAWLSDGPVGDLRDTLQVHGFRSQLLQKELRNLNGTWGELLSGILYF